MTQVILVNLWASSFQFLIIQITQMEKEKHMLQLFCTGSSIDYQERTVYGANQIH